MYVLLAVLNRRESAGAVLAAAALTAARLQPARIEVWHVRPATDPAFMPTEEIMTPARQASFTAAMDADSTALRAQFETWRASTATGTDIAWRDETGNPPTVLAREAPAADLVLIGRAAHREPGSGQQAIDAVLFEAHAPLILVPEQTPQSIGAHIAIAWKASDTAERAVIAALPLLRTAERVTILVDAAAATAAPPPAALRDALAERGLVPDLRPFTQDGQTIGTALLLQARLAGADLLVMGAYAHRRAMEALLGGATRDILAAADIPVFLRH